MKFFYFAGSAAILACAAVAQAPQPGQHAPRPQKMQTETRADVSAAVAKHFAKLDANHDGFVTTAEADALQAQRSDKAEQRAEKRAERFDPAKIFARLDANGDGKVTKAEAAATARVQAKGEPAKAHAVAFGSLFERADANKDGVITKGEFGAVGAQMHARTEKAGMPRGFAGRMFQTADVNKDGKLSLAEAQQAAVQHFDRADLNHDGKLTGEEREQARQLRRGQHQPS